MIRETEEGLKLDEKAPVPEKQGALEDAPQAEENKDNKDTNEEEEKEEDKVYFFCWSCIVYSSFWRQNRNVSAAHLSLTISVIC